MISWDRPEGWRACLRRLLLGMLLMGLVVGIERSQAAERPNVLLICVDDLKPVLGCYGNRVVKSPNIDRLAARGMRFDLAYCNQAVCAPSRNSLLVGLRPQTLGIYDLGTHFRRARPDAVTLPQYFKDRGWRSEALGKLFHVGHGNTNDPRSWSVPLWSAKVVAYAEATNRPKPAMTREEALFANLPAQGLPRGAAVESADVPDSTYPDGAIADEAVRRIESAKGREPFFLAVGFVKPHLPFVAPKRYWDLYDRSKFELAALRTAPKGAPAYAPQYGGEIRQYAGIPESGPLPDDLQRTLIHGYHAAVSYMDAQLGRVLEALDRTGLAANTIIVLWGDHGWHLGDHGIWCKHTNYEQAARIPLLVVAPGVKPGTATRSMVETVDLYPTLCELAGLPVPAGLDGRSFVPTLRDGSVPARDHVVHVFPRHPAGKGEVIGRAVRTPRHRLVEWKAAGGAASSAEFELYDYQEAPDEAENLASSKPEVVAAMRALLAGHPEAKPQWRPAAGGGGTDRGAMFERRDVDRDGKLTREEFLKGQPDPEQAPARFQRFDVDGNGVLSREEFVSQGRR